MWLGLNGIDLSAIASARAQPDEPRRDIGIKAPADDGSLVWSRVKRKRDFSFTSILVLGTEAAAWAGLVSGDGEHWSFDASLYGSKGLGPTGTLNAVQIAGTPKFGAGVLRVNATTGTITYAAAIADPSGGVNKWTVMVWRFEGGVWHHYIVTSAGHKWLDGVRADGTSTTWLTVNGTSGNVVISNATGAAQDYDDLVCLPYEILDTWGPTFGTAVAAFSELPYLTATGLLVTDASSRRMCGDCSMKVQRAAKAGAVQKDMRVLAVTLQEA
jgi:hypothetical protein